MQYTQPIVKGSFRSRPNRFIAKVDIDGRLETCHVKNTGRCKELLTDGATVYLEHWDSSKRKTNYDLIAVEKGSLLINMDSQAPNKVAGEYLPTLFPDYTLIKPEVTHGSSRVDFYLERPGEQWFIEVKGVTLEDGGIVRFPDAPTERGVKHVEELTHALTEGYRTMILFVVQMEGMQYVEPNDVTHPAFGETLRKARAAGVEVRAVECHVTPETLTALREIPVKL